MRGDDDGRGLTVGHNNPDTWKAEGGHTVAENNFRDQPVNHAIMPAQNGIRPTMLQESELEEKNRTFNRVYGCYLAWLCV